jgi:hypothetical protein
VKKIPKKLLDECIEATRTYWTCPAVEDSQRYKEKFDNCHELMNVIGVDWSAISDFLDSILRLNGFCPDAENDEIYCALRTLGWEPTE